MFHKQNTRQPVAAALLAVLLALATAFSCIGLSGWASFRRQLAELDAQYTTVAYPMNNESPVRYDYLPVEEYEDGSLRFEDGNIWASTARVNGLVEKAPGFLHRDTNLLTAAHTPNQKGFSSGAADPLTYVGVYDRDRYAQSVVAMRCLSVEKNPSFGGKILYQNYYTIWFEWIDPVCRMDAYDLPEHSRILEFNYNGTMTIDEEGNPYPPFEEGKTYLLRGRFTDFRLQYWFKSKEEGHCWFRYTQDYVRSMYEGFNEPYEDPTLNPTKHLNDSPWQSFSIDLPLRGEDGSSLTTDLMGHPYPLVPNFYLGAKELPEEKNNLGFGWSSHVPEDGWPLFTEYEGDWRDFLNTEEGRVWRDEIIPCCETSHNSVAVLLTDNIQGLSQFCKQESALLEGRFITQEEYDRGNAVCMVSADYALYNGLQVGDTLTLDLYRPAYFTSGGSIWHSAQPAFVYYTCCMPLVEENRLNVTRDYTIVGLYTAPVRPADPDGHGFRGDTVLLPKASVPELADTPEDKVTPLLNMLVLKNGSIEEFEAYMAENGTANRFRYYDYGYSEMKESIETMESSALRLAILGGAAFLIGAAVFLLASFARMSAPARGLRLLGASPRKVTGDMLSALLPLTAAGVLLGGILGGLLYERVCDAVLSQTLAPDWPGVAAVAGLQLVVLGAAAAVWAALTARRGLMKRKQE